MPDETIPVTIGLDVLKALVDMAAPRTQAHCAYRVCALNAINAAEEEPVADETLGRGYRYRDYPGQGEG